MNCLSICLFLSPFPLGFHILNHVKFRCVCPGVDTVEVKSSSHASQPYPVPSWSLVFIDFTFSFQQCQGPFPVLAMTIFCFDYPSPYRNIVSMQHCWLRGCAYWQACQPPQATCLICLASCGDSSWPICGLRLLQRHVVSMQNPILLQSLEEALDGALKCSWSTRWSLKQGRRVVLVDGLILLTGSLDCPWLLMSWPGRQILRCDWCQRLCHVVWQFGSDVATMRLVRWRGRLYRLWGATDIWSPLLSPWEMTAMWKGWVPSTRLWLTSSPPPLPPHRHCYDFTRSNYCRSFLCVEVTILSVECGRPNNQRLPLRTSKRISSQTNMQCYYYEWWNTDVETHTAITEDFIRLQVMWPLSAECILWSLSPEVAACTMSALCSVFLHSFTKFIFEFLVRSITGGGRGHYNGSLQHLYTYTVSMVVKHVVCCSLRGTMLYGCTFPQQVRAIWWWLLDSWKWTLSKTNW